MNPLQAHTDIIEIVVRRSYEPPLSRYNCCDYHKAMYCVKFIARMASVNRAWRWATRRITDKFSEWREQIALLEMRKYLFEYQYQLYELNVKIDNVGFYPFGVTKRPLSDARRERQAVARRRRVEDVHNFRRESKMSYGGDINYTSFANVARSLASQA
jgi:hypothetical protein